MKIFCCSFATPSWVSDNVPIALQKHSCKSFGTPNLLFVNVGKMGWGQFYDTQVFTLQKI